MSIADELTKLADLKKSGVLTEEEFQAQKSRLLGGDALPQEGGKAASGGAKSKRGGFGIAALVIGTCVAGFLFFKQSNKSEWELTSSLTSDTEIMGHVSRAAEGDIMNLPCLYRGAVAYRLAEAREAGIGSSVAVLFTQDSMFVGGQHQPSKDSVRNMAEAIYKANLTPDLTRSKYVKEC